jgi:hypothetical protein
MSGGQHVSTTDLGVVPPGWSIKQAAEVNGDGTTDLIWQSNNGQTLAWTMTGGQHVSTNDLGTVPSVWHIQPTG